MMNYIHNTKISNKSTAAYEEIDSDYFFSQMGISLAKKLVPSVMLPLGIAICHKNDQYRKDVGRMLAEVSLEPVGLRLVRIHPEDNADLYLMDGVHSKGRVRVNFRVYHDSKNIRVTCVYVY
jgi:hypothetical protein